MSLNVVKQLPLKGIDFVPKLIKDFLDEKESLRHLYSFKFALENVESAIEQKRTQRTNRKVLVDVLNDQYSKITTTSLVKENIALLLDENTFTITAAHQPCLFLGPVYNLVKISATITAAKKCKEQFPEYNFVPVFWMGSEDHDKEELCHTFIGDKKIEWENNYSGAIGKFGLEGLDKSIEAFKIIAGQDNPLISFVENHINILENFGQLTQSLVNEIFEDFGLVVLDQNEKKLKELFIPFIVDELKNGRAESELANQINWLEANYHAQARPRPINFFFLSENSRERIIRTDRGYETTNENFIATKENIHQFIENNPEKFSPNVMFRPLFQEVVLPNICFVGGGGEISYWLEQKPLFDFYKVPFPMLAHRPLVNTLRKNQVTKLEKLGLTFEELLQAKDKVITSWIKQNSSTDLAINTEKDALKQIYETLILKVKSIDPTLESSIKSELQKSLNGLDNIQGKIIKAEKRNQETAIQQITAIYAGLYPANQLWERTENSINFLSKLSKDEFRQFVFMQDVSMESLLFIETE